MKGPARVTFNVPVHTHGLQARGASEGEPGEVIVLCQNTVLEVRP